MQKVVQITPAHNWVYKDIETCSMIPVAVWALLENGDIIGMVSNDDFPIDSTAGSKLIAPPSGGYYMRLNQPLHVDINRSSCSSVEDSIHLVPEEANLERRPIVDIGYAGSGLLGWAPE